MKTYSYRTPAGSPASIFSCSHNTGDDLWPCGETPVVVAIQNGEFQGEVWCEGHRPEESRVDPDRIKKGEMND